MLANKQKGFTYLMLLWWVAVSSILVTALAQSWQIETRRQREIELLYRGEQIRSAIESYAKVPVAAGVSPLPARLENLLEDTRSGVMKRHLRQVWLDPITGSAQWGLVRDQRGILGVYSTSNMRPIRAPKDIKTYQDWRFVAAAMPSQSASGPVFDTAIR
jgi:type II secretory pathway pseudopilin PulG